MISCTEFIPLYSEFFKFLDSRGGYDEVLKYWYHISDTSLSDPTNPHSMVYHMDRLGGFDGALAYWGHTTTEEACDTYGVLDPVQRYSYSEMRYCPSRGMLNELEHIEPYEHYCEHCKVIYNRVLDRYGVVFERDHSLVHKAQCSCLLYEAGNKPGDDYKEPKEGRIVKRLKREGQKYLHRDFHLLGDNAIKYCGDNFGAQAAVDFVKHFAVAFYAPQIEVFKEKGLPAVKEWLEKLYLVEEASEVLHTQLSDNELRVRIDKCPVVAYARSLNQELSEYYIEQTRTLYAAIAEASGLSFRLDKYDADGAAEFVFYKK